MLDNYNKQKNAFLEFGLIHYTYDGFYDPVSSRYYLFKDKSKFGIMDLSSF